MVVQVRDADGKLGKGGSLRDHGLLLLDEAIQQHNNSAATVGGACVPRSAIAAATGSRRVVIVYIKARVVSRQRLSSCKTTIAHPTCRRKGYSGRKISDSGGNSRGRRRLAQEGQ